jgi:hypothetical protein
MMREDTPKEKRTVVVDPPIVALSDADRLIRVREIHTGKDFYISVREIVDRLNMFAEVLEDITL